MVCKQWSLERFVVKTTSPSQPYIWMWPPVTLTKMKLERMALIPCDGSLRAFMRRQVTLTSHFDQIKQQLSSSRDYVINSFTNFSLTSCFCIGYWIIISFHHINCGVQQGFPALRKAVTTHVKKNRIFFRVLILPISCWHVTRLWRHSVRSQKEKPKITYSVALVLAFLAAENENRQLEDLPLADFARLPERLNLSVRTKSINENFVNWKLGPLLFL